MNLYVVLFCKIFLRDVGRRGCITLGTESRTPLPRVDGRVEHLAEATFHQDPIQKIRASPKNKSTLSRAYMFLEVTERS